MRKALVIWGLLLGACLLAGFGDPGVLARGERLPELGEFAEPPGLLVSCGERQARPTLGNSSWSRPQPGGSMACYVACGSHMLENMEQRPESFPRLRAEAEAGQPRLLELEQLCPFMPRLPQGAERISSPLLHNRLPLLELPGGGERIALAWQLPPDRLRVEVYDYERWASRTCGNTLPEELLLAEFVPLDRTSLPLWPEGGVLYVLHAQWGEGAGQPGGRRGVWLLSGGGARAA